MSLPPQGTESSSTTRPRGHRRSASIDEEPTFGNGRFALGRTLGEGSFGKCKMCTALATNTKFAVKIIEKKLLKTKADLDGLAREIKVMSLLNHPNIIKLEDVVEDSKRLYLVMEYCEGGELFDYLTHQQLGRCTERQTRRLFREIVSALNYCHENYVAHRDIKLENILLDAENRVRVIDFGLSNMISRRDTLLKTKCGSAYYAAPEIVATDDPYTGPEVDIWSLGVVLYALVCGGMPFGSTNTTPAELFDNIQNGRYSIPSFVSDGCRDLITKIFVVDVKRRITMAEIIAHPWVNIGYDSPLDTHLPVRYPVLALQTEVIKALVDIGFDGPIVEEEVMANRPGLALAVYHMASERYAREHGGAHAPTKDGSPPFLLPTPVAAAGSPTPIPISVTAAESPKGATSSTTPVAAGGSSAGGFGSLGPPSVSPAGGSAAAKGHRRHRSVGAPPDLQAIVDGSRGGGGPSGLSGGLGGGLGGGATGRTRPSSAMPVHATIAEEVDPPLVRLAMHNNSVSKMNSPTGAGGGGGGGGGLASPSAAASGGSSSSGSSTSTSISTSTSGAVPAVLPPLTPAAIAAPSITTSTTVVADEAGVGTSTSAGSSGAGEASGSSPAKKKSVFGTLGEVKKAVFGTLSQSPNDDVGIRAGKERREAHRRRASVATTQDAEKASSSTKTAADERLREVTGPFSVDTTSQKPAGEILDQLRRVLHDTTGVTKVIGRDFSLDVDMELVSLGEKAFLSFSIEIVRLKQISLHGLKFKRIAGEIWVFQEAVQTILAKLQL